MRILAVTDLNSVGSGYATLSLPIMVELVKLGHEVKIIGLSNDGKQHNFPFSIIPARDMREVLAMIQNLWTLWTFDVLMVLIDINIQKALMEKMENRPFKYVGVFPIESDPLSMEWAMVLFQMDKPFIISQFGVEEAHKRYIQSAEYLPPGIDTNAWRVPNKTERDEIRKAYGFNEDTFVVLTVADNQERKNLPACFEAFQLLSKEYPNSRYILVTREHLYAGWNITELADAFDITGKLMVFERGLPFKKLWSLYAASDAFLLLSKAEGYGLPILEAKAMRIPVIGTDCSGIHEQLQDDMGFLVPHRFMHIDPFGNGYRYWADPASASAYLKMIASHSVEVGHVVENAFASALEHTWENSVKVIQQYLESIHGETKPQTGEPINLLIEPEIEE